jgi:hypothetical protein
VTSALLPAPASVVPVTGRIRPRLVGPRLDAWLLGGAGIVAWVVMQRPLGLDLPVTVPTLGGPVLWVLLAIIGTHFGISYHLAYGQGRTAVKRRAGLLIGVPVGLAVAAVAVCVAALVGSEATARLLTRALLATVFTLTGWHYIKQVYGVTRLTAAMHGLSIDRRSGQILRYGLYPVWFLDAAIIWTVGFRPTQYGFDAGANVLPRLALGLVGVLVAASAVALVVCLVRLAVVWRRLPPASMWTPIVAGMLWLTFTPDHVSGILVLGALHAIQYLACAHRAELSWAVERGEPRAGWWASVFGAGLATGMLLSYWMPMWLGSATDATGLGLFPAALLFVFFNLHHYAVDAAIWRSGGDHIRRIVRS